METEPFVTCPNCGSLVVPTEGLHCPHCKAAMVCSWCMAPFTAQDLRAVVETPGGTFATVHDDPKPCRDVIERAVFDPAGFLTQHLYKDGMPVNPELWAAAGLAFPGEMPAQIMSVPPIRVEAVSAITGGLDFDALLAELNGRITAELSSMPLTPPEPQHTRPIENKHADQPDPAPADEAPRLDEASRAFLAQFGM